MAGVSVPHSRFVFPAALRTPRCLLIFSRILVVLAFVSSPTGNRSSMASSGTWMGSGLDDQDIRKLRRGRFLGRTDDVGARAPDSKEISPKPKKGEFVVFLTHLERGLGLPASPFFQEFLRFYGLQPHHLGDRKSVV